MMLRIAQHPILLVFLFVFVSTPGAVFQEDEASPPSQPEAEEPSKTEEEVQQSPTSTANSGPGSGTGQRGLIEDVSVSDVKRFLDPTQLISRVEYDFQANFLPNDARLFTNRFRP